MTEQEYKQHRKKENLLYLWFNIIDISSMYIGAGLIGSSITLSIIGGYGWFPLIITLSSMAIWLLGKQIAKILKDKWEYEFSICANYMGDKLMERFKKDEADRENKE